MSVLVYIVYFTYELTVGFYCSSSYIGEIQTHKSIYTIAHVSQM